MKSIVSLGSSRSQTVSPRHAASHCDQKKYVLLNNNGTNKTEWVHNRQYERSSKEETGWEVVRCDSSTVQCGQDQWELYSCGVREVRGYGLVAAESPLTTVNGQQDGDFRQAVN